MSWAPAFIAKLLLHLDVAEEEVDTQVAAALSRTTMPPARHSGDAYSIPNSGPGMAASPGDLTQCEGCGRSFNPKAFEVHSRICAKVFQVSLQAARVVIVQTFCYHACRNNCNHTSSPCMQKRCDEHICMITMLCMITVFLHAL